MNKIMDIAEMRNLLTLNPFVRTWHTHDYGTPMGYKSLTQFGIGGK